VLFSSCWNVCELFDCTTYKYFDEKTDDGFLDVNLIMFLSSNDRINMETTLLLAWFVLTDTLFVTQLNLVIASLNSLPSQFILLSMLSEISMSWFFLFTLQLFMSQYSVLINSSTKPCVRIQISSTFVTCYWIQLYKYKIQQFQLHIMLHMSYIATWDL
jgi:hypothetical protein